jgi:hypothetical protein
MTRELNIRTAETTLRATSLTAFRVDGLADDSFNLGLGGWLSFQQRQVDVLTKVG